MLQVKSFRDNKIPVYGAIAFSVLIAVIGAFMMTLTSSPQMKGASLLWLPAALQLIAGVWFGPKKGLLAGGIGAYAAGILAYGGWGIVDIIMNLVAGGLANSFLPAIFFRVFKINPEFGAQPADIVKATVRILLILIPVLAMGLLPLFTSIGLWSYAAGLILLVIGMPIIFSGIRINKVQFVIAILICLISCLLSALLGCVGVVIGGNTWKAAIIGTGIGWFAGDFISSILGLYILCLYTSTAIEKGLYRP